MLFLSNIDYIPHNRGIEDPKTIDDLLDAPFYLLLDTYNNGIFAHAPLEPAPRRLIWAPVDLAWGMGIFQCFVSRKAPGWSYAESVCCLMLLLEAEQCDMIVTHLHDNLGVGVKDAERDPVTAPAYLLPKQEKEDASQVKYMGPDHETVTTPEGLHPKQEETDVILLSGGSLASDLNCLREPGFLSSDLISFTLNSLASTVNTDEILLIWPSVSYFLYNDARPDSVAAQVEELNLDARSMVLFPINNNEDPSIADGGTHWSLLVLDQRVPGIRRFSHYDSAGGLNDPFAQHLVERLTPLSGREVILIESQGPQQDNGYDCGLFLIATAKEICRWWMSSSEEDWKVVVARQVNPGSVAALRVDLLQRIESSLRKKKPP
ncbi:NEDD8-specific protease 1 [Dichanthelium oligosanthes]|uniref:NEDD8-specific protease 1 n=1 Tax=Dichanthelium oligosanthes TaxID=888268 RepID=A0A1E5V344_9POAL|nr:NEDD8-specific protease 1 [Dichanthelium oligosanthes]